MVTKLLVIGVSHHTARVETRERFTVSHERLPLVLQELVRSGPVEEAAVLSTCNRTEYILWTGDRCGAVNCVKDSLHRAFGLKPEEWDQFYCLFGEDALLHIFRVASSLDSMVVGETEITGQVKSAWARAQKAGSSGRFLDAILRKALQLSKRVRNETAISESPVSIPYAAVAFAKRIFGSLETRRVLIVGAGKMGEQSLRNLVSCGVGAVWVVNRSFEHAAKLAQTFGGTVVPFEDRWKKLAEADILISSTGSSEFILTREEAESVCQKRQGRHLLLIDIAVPRDVDPAVRQVAGFFLFDIDDLEQAVARNLGQRQAAAVEAEKIVLQEAQSFRRELDAERLAPTISALRARLEEIRRRELQLFQNEGRPLSETEMKELDSLTARMMDRLAGVLARELKQVNEKPQQDQIVAALRRLFQLGHSDPRYAAHREITLEGT